MRINTTIRFLQTNQVRLIIFISLILPGSHSSLSYSQDIYNLEQSRKYAEYLSSGHQYSLAAEEYERLIFLDRNDVSFKVNLIKSYRLSGNYNTGIKRIYTLYPDSLSTMPQLLATEFLKLELLADSLPVAEKFMLQSKTLSSENKSVYKCFDLLLKGGYNEAAIYVKNTEPNSYIFPTNIVRLTEKAENTRFKSPFIAGSLSAIIPGTGKFYTKNWADGVFSMLFVAGNAWQAYRGFNKYGNKSAYAWTFAGISASFYIGNIFGAVKAAKRYNKNKKYEIENQVFEIIGSDNY